MICLLVAFVIDELWQVHLIGRTQSTVTLLV